MNSTLHGAPDARNLDPRAVARALGGVAYGKRVSAPGPAHSHGDRSLSLLIAPAAPEGFVVNSFAGDDVMACRDYVRKCLGLPPWRHCSHAKAYAPPQRHVQRGSTSDENNVALARHLWGKRLPIGDSLAETYLRDSRGYKGPIPSPLGFLPAHRHYQPAMIAAFALAREIEPGDVQVLHADVHAVHLTKLVPDGSGRIDAPDAKIIVGRRAMGVPIVISPPNDLLGLAITEGIEDGLSVFAATGLGVWVAGAANRMPALAESVPAWIDRVTVYADNDSAGRQGARELVRRLRARNISAAARCIAQVAP
jgi:Toprim domain